MGVTAPARQSEGPVLSGCVLFPRDPGWSYPLPAPPCSGDQIVGATIYFDNLQSGEVTQLLNTMGHRTVGLKLHRKGDRSPEPGQTWTHDVSSSHSPDVVLVSAWLAGRALSSPDHADGLVPLPEPLSARWTAFPSWLLSCSHPLLSVEPACFSFSRVAAAKSLLSVSSEGPRLGTHSLVYSSVPGGSWLLCRHL